MTSENEYSDPELVAIIDVLKRRLRRQNITYKDVAQGLGLSEVSIKRVFSKYECTLSRLSSLCKFANTSILEISDIARMDTQEKDYFLKKNQESYFIKHPFYFHLFRLIYRGVEVESLKERYSISDEEMFRVLRDLETLNLLEIHPNDKIRPSIKGKIRLDLKGEIFNQIVKKQNQEFLNEVYKQYEREDCCLQSSEIQLSKKSVMEFVEEVNQLGRKYRERSLNEERFLNQDKLFDVRWLMALMPFTSDWEQYRKK